jgi:hypothetical protein
MNRSARIPILALSLVFQAIGQTVTLPKPDAKGWIKLFRGTNTQDFYTHHKANEDNGPFPDASFKIKGDTIQVTGGWGHLAFKQTFSHYRLRTEMLHETNGNGGVLLHIREQDPSFDIFPRSLEFQGNDGSDGNGEMGELWTISDVWATVKVKSKDGTCRYDSAGTELAQTGRLCHGSSIPPYLLMKWDTLEAIVHGSDSITHIVNGKTIIKYTQVRIATSSTDLSRPLDSGRIGWQGEGAKVWYRNMEIKLFPEDPLYQTLYPTSMKGIPGIASRREARRFGVGSGTFGPTGEGRLYEIDGRALKKPLADPHR